jgi:hypothetical protein
MSFATGLLDFGCGLFRLRNLFDMIRNDPSAAKS